MQKSNLGNPLDFLSAALDPPNKQNVARAMSILREIEACDRTSTTLTPLGHHLATLPVDVRLGKMLIFGAIFGCLESIVSRVCFYSCSCFQFGPSLAVIMLASTEFVHL